MKNTQLTARSLDNSGPVGGGVVAGGERLLSVICGSLSQLHKTLKCLLFFLSFDNRGIKKGSSPVTASVGHAVARHFVGWRCELSCREGLT